VERRGKGSPGDWRLSPAVNPARRKIEWDTLVFFNGKESRNGCSPRPENRLSVSVTIRLDRWPFKICINLDRTRLRGIAYGAAICRPFHFRMDASRNKALLKQSH